MTFAFVLDFSTFVGSKPEDGKLVLHPSEVVIAEEATLIRRYGFLFFLLSFGFGSITLDASLVRSATASSDESDVFASERGWVNVTIAGNADAFASYMSDDYVELSLVNASSTRRVHWDVRRKAEWVDLIRSKREKYKSVNLSDLKVYLHGDVATVTGYYTQKGTSNGKSNDASGTYVNTWVKKDGRWRIVSSAFP